MKKRDLVIICGADTPADSEYQAWSEIVQPGDCYNGLIAWCHDYTKWLS